MLEQMRKSSQSLLIYVLFGIVIAVFIINFGPQSRGGCEKMDRSDSFALQVGDQNLSSNEFMFGYRYIRGPEMGGRLAKQRHAREFVMDRLIERELLAQEAERLGLRVTNEEVEDFIAESRIMGLGDARAVPKLQKDGKFNYEYFKNFVQFEMGLTPKHFIDEQRRELLAARMRELLQASVVVSPDEVKADFERRGRQVNLEYVRFAGFQYENAIAPTPQEVEAYAASHTAKLQELYNQRKFFYEKAPRELHLRQIVVKTEAAADKGKDEAAAASADTGAAEKKANDVAARIRKGEAFATVARQVSDDARTRARGGDMGWKRKGATPLGPEVEEKVFAAKQGELVGPVKGPEGFYLVTVEGAREGDITFEQAKQELAEEELRKEQAMAHAKADADAALKKAQAAPDKSLKDLFPGEEKKDPLAPPVARAEETGLISRQGNDVTGIGSSKELATAAFGLKTEAPIAGPFDVSGGIVIVRLKERKDPDMAEFEKQKDELQNTAERIKAWQVVSEWMQNRCSEAKQAKRIRFNPDMLRYEESGEGAASQPVRYEPCTRGRL